MSLLELSLYTFLVYLCVYGVVNRICKCKEYCAKNGLETEKQ